MLPEIGTALAGDFSVEELSSRTFALDFDRERIAGMTDELEAMRQAIYLILSTERYQYLIYGWDYGVELVDLFGQPTDYVQSELKRRITEALAWDSRITSVEDFVFNVKGRRVGCIFLVKTIYGDVRAERAVDI